MKYLCLIILVLITISSFSQTSSYYKVTEISVVSPGKDTLWLINNSTGFLIARSWEIGNNIEEKKPVIIFTDVLPNPNISLNETKHRKKRYIKGKK